MKPMHAPSTGIGGYHCTVCGLTVEYDPDKRGMVDISGSTYCPDLEPHRVAPGTPDSRLSADAVFRAAVDSLAAESYDVEAGWQRFRAWMIEQGYVVPDDGPPFRNPLEDQGDPSHGTTHRPL